MQKLLSFILMLRIFCTSINAQDILPRQNPGCIMNLKNKPPYLPNADAFLRQQLAQRLGDPFYDDFTSPYYIRVFIRIVREDNGTLPGCTMEEALQNFNEMNLQYNPHNICFQLAGIDFVNDSYLNNFNIESFLDNIYPSYIRNNNLDVEGAMTIFIHYNFLNNNSSSGNAYSVPNNFLSVARWAAQSTTVHSIFGHEMGHCLGLYHTFETSFGEEAVTRSASNSCYNCNIDGDMCCDTPADYADSEDNTSSSTCIYSGTKIDLCSFLLYNPSIVNIMSYQPWSCISSTGLALTANQRTRMHASILNPLGPIYSRVSEENYVQPSIINNSGLVKIYAAKNSVSNSGNSIIHTGAAKAYYVAGGSITFSPGVNFTPNSSGIVQVSISGCN